LKPYITTTNYTTPATPPNRTITTSLLHDHYISYDQKNKNTSETIGEEDEAVRTEATRAREPFMFSLWVFSINLRDLI
jgi:hypothetical protein